MDQDPCGRAAAEIDRIASCQLRLIMSNTRSKSERILFGSNDVAVSCCFRRHVGI